MKRATFTSMELENILVNVFAQLGIKHGLRTINEALVGPLEMRAENDRGEVLEELASLVMNLVTWDLCDLLKIIANKHCYFDSENFDQLQEFRAELHRTSCVLAGVERDYWDEVNKRGSERRRNEKMEATNEQARLEAAMHTLKVKNEHN